MKNSSPSIRLLSSQTGTNEQIFTYTSGACDEDLLGRIGNSQPEPPCTSTKANVAKEVSNELSLNLDDLTACCLAEPSGKNKYIACSRPASGIPLCEKMLEMSVLKRFPLVYNNSRRHYYVCLYHRRIIHCEPKLRRNESWGKRDLTKYDQNLIPTDEEKQEMRDDPLLKPYEALPKFRRSNAYRREMEEKLKLNQQKRRKVADVLDLSGSEGSIDFEDYQTRHSGRDVNNSQMSFSDSLGKGIKKEKFKKFAKEIKNMRNEEEDLEDTESELPMPKEVPMKVLPANTLRRYKKAFQLPHRSGTNTKSQLLEGISEHLATLQVPAHETIAQFLYHCKMHKNKLDYPVSNDSSDSNIGHYIS